MAANRKKATARHTEDTPVKSFLDMIAPSVVKFNPDHFICGNTFRCVWALREYPTQTDEQALLRHLGEKDGITLRIYTRQLTPAEDKLYPRKWTRDFDPWPRSADTHLTHRVRSAAPVL